MCAHGEPEIPSAPERSCRKKCEEAGGDDSDFRLSTISHVDNSEQDGLNDGRRPKPDSVCQGVKKVAAQHVFFKKSNQQKNGKPEKPPPKNLRVQRGNVSEIESMRHAKEQEQESERKKSP